MFVLRILNDDGTTRDESFSTEEERTKAAMAYQRKKVSTLGIGPERTLSPEEEADTQSLFLRMGD